MQLLKNYIIHFRFTFGEFRTNVRRFGFSTAYRFFVMRSFLPFGRPQQYFINRTPKSDVVSQIDETGFSELQKITSEKIQKIFDRLVKCVSVDIVPSVRSISDYVDFLRKNNIQRKTIIISDGTPDCILAEIARSPAFAGLSAEYLEMDPADLVVEATVDILVSAVANRISGVYDDALEFHRDIDAYRFFKIFVYLTDCEEGEGHHEIYLGSHRKFPLQLVPIKRYHASEIEKLIPNATLKKVVGTAGYAFGENTQAFHRGTRPVRNHRVILNLIYTEKSFSKYYSNAFPLIVR